METDETTPDPTTQDSHPEAPNNDAQAEAETQQQPQQQPVVPGPRASRLQELYAQSLKRTLGKLKWDNFAACYPTVASRAEPVLKQVQAQMVEKLGEKCEVRSFLFSFFSSSLLFYFIMAGRIKESLNRL